jgi:deoxycytidine triphosphate deaminase
VVEPSAVEPRFAATDAEAEARYARWKGRDPYPDIPSALLNSADFVDYVSATGMIHPFEPQDRRLKPASYLVDIGGPYVYWDRNGEKVRGELTSGKAFTLPRNTIAFVSLQPNFRLPEYIAFRFNLQIKYIHAGLLVGTGPLVDPGFVGSLLLPLHNLTDNDYAISVDDGLVWMEFTKVSPVTRWSDWTQGKPDEGGEQEALPAPVRAGVYAPFPEAKKRRTTIDPYLIAAFPGSIRSSIPAEIEKSRRSVRRLSGFGIAGILAIIVTLVVLMINVLQLVNSSNALVEGVTPASTESVSELRSEVLRLEDQVLSLQKQLSAKQRTKK